MSHKFNKDLRIGIIGAGPAGLASAEALKDKGYNNILVLEKRNRVGGQSLSLRHTINGEDIIYEAGSLQPVSAWHGAFNRLLKKYNIETGKAFERNNASEDTLYLKLYSYEQRKVLLDFSRSLIGYSYKDTLPYLLDLMTLSYYLIRYRKLALSGYNHLPKKYIEELSIPFSQWIDARKFRLIGKELKLIAGSLITFTNPRLKDKVPAIKMFKLLLQLIQFPPRYINGSFRLVKQGYQEIWNQVAKHHNVLLNCDINKITRTETEVIVELKDQTITFDKLIVSCTPNDLGNALDITSEEKIIFDKIHFAPGWRGAFIAKNLPHDAVYGSYEPFEIKDKPVYLHAFMPEGKIDEHTWLYGSIIAYPHKENIDMVKKEIQKTLKEHFGGEIIEWVNLTYWREYSPYFLGEDVSNGIYKRIEALQGKYNTYYISGFVSGGTHSIVTNYAYAMIKTFF